MLESELAQLGGQAGSAFPEASRAAGRISAGVIAPVERVGEFVGFAHPGGIRDDNWRIDAGDGVGAGFRIRPIEDFARFREPQQRAEVQRAAVPIERGEAAGLVFPTKIDAEKSQKL